MKKVFIALWLSLFYSSALLGGYEIKLGVYKNTKNLQLNLHNIKPVKFQKYITVRRNNDLNYVHAMIDGNQAEAEKALKIYKSIFKDAFIVNRKIKLANNIPQKKSKKISSITPEKVSELVSKKQFDAQALLKHKTIYLCYEADARHAKKRIMELKFLEKTLKYKSLLDDYEPIDIPYHFDKENIYLKMSGLDFKHTIDKTDINFLYLKSFINGKKAHRLRYYFTLKDAKQYMGSI